MEGVSSIPEANAWIDSFLEIYNARFSKPPALPVYEGRELGYREFDKLMQTHQGEVVPHKRLGAMLALISENQKYLPQEKRSIKCPTRRYPAPARLT